MTFEVFNGIGYFVIKIKRGSAFFQKIFFVTVRSFRAHFDF